MSPALPLAVATDAFLLRRVDGARFAHLGGTGRGEGWAGVVDLRLDAEPRAALALADDAVVRVDEPSPVCVFGPYWAATAAFVPLDHDQLVVFGGLIDGHDDEALRLTAAALAGGVQSVSPAKRLADELELVHTVRAVLALEPPDVPTALKQVCGVVTQALSCELGVLWAPGAPTAVVQRGGYVAPASAAQLGAVVASLVQAGLPACEQDAREVPLPAPLDDAGVTSWLALPVEGGALLCCHTEVVPRGFTALCQELGARSADAAASVLRTAQLRQRLEGAAESAQREARVDPLTGLGNRLAWDEASRHAPEPLAVVLTDLDNLKVVNDSAGHHAGDALLRALADVLRAATREGDVVARLGGDEFAVLLPGADGIAARAVGERIEALLAAHAPVEGRRPQATIGLACAPPQIGAEGALRAADALVRLTKSEHRRGRA